MSDIGEVEIDKVRGVGEIGRVGVIEEHGVSSKTTSQYQCACLICAVLYSTG